MYYSTSAKVFLIFEPIYYGLVICVLNLKLEGVNDALG